MLDQKYLEKIILIGPIRVGKSTLGKLLSDTFGIPQRSLDQAREYYDEIGYDHKLVDQYLAEQDFFSIYQYWKPFEAYAVEKVLQEPGRAIIDFGGGHSVYEDQTLFDRVKTALAPFPFILLILPDPDPERSIEILNERTGGFVSRGFDFHRHFVLHPANYILAKQTIYTGSNSPAETCQQVIQWLKSNGWTNN